MEGKLHHAKNMSGDRYEKRFPKSLNGTKERVNMTNQFMSISVNTKRKKRDPDTNYRYFYNKKTLGIGGVLGV